MLAFCNSAATSKSSSLILSFVESLNKSSSSAGSKPVRETVEIGASDDTYTEITSGNIQEGDRIIVSSDGKSSKQDSKDNRKPPMRMF